MPINWKNVDSGNVQPDFRGIGSTYTGASNALKNASEGFKETGDELGQIDASNIFAQYKTKQLDPNQAITLAAKRGVGNEFFEMLKGDADRRSVLANANLTDVRTDTAKAEQEFIKPLANVELEGRRLNNQGRELQLEQQQQIAPGETREILQQQQISEGAQAVNKIAANLSLSNDDFSKMNVGQQYQFIQKNYPNILPEALDASKVGQSKAATDAAILEQQVFEAQETIKAKTAGLTKAAKKNAELAFINDKTIPLNVKEKLYDTLIFNGKDLEFPTKKTPKTPKDTFDLVRDNPLIADALNLGPHAPSLFNWKGSPSKFAERLKDLPENTQKTIQGLHEVYTKSNPEMLTKTLQGIKEEYGRVTPDLLNKTIDRYLVRLREARGQL